MGAYAWVGIPEDLECGMIETESHSEAWLIVEMCSPWMDGSQDESDFREIPGAAMRAADREVPMMLTQYDGWRLEKLATWPDGQGRLWDITGQIIGQAIFDRARNFIRTYAQSSETEGAEFML